MQNKKQFFIITAAIIALIVVFSSAYVVDETQQVIITQLGKPVGNAITNPGIHFKVPLLQNANYFDKRFLEWDGDANQIPTKDKRFIYVDTYARWRIADPLLFFQRVRDERGAQARLDDILDGETRNAVANHELEEIVRNTNRKPVISDTLNYDEVREFKAIRIGRSKISQEILANASVRTKELGIELLDLRFKRINYIEAVQRKIYEQMITERKRIADRFRSQGQGQASKILGKKDRELKRIQSEAYRQSQEIKGKADAQATNIYAKAYNQSPDSRSFYSFIKTLETYRNTISEKDLLILSTSSDYFKFLKKSTGK